VREFLLHPSGALTGWLHHLTAAAVAAAPGAGAAGAAVLILAVTGWVLLGRRRRRLLAAGARLITVLPPPHVDPAGAQALWSNLMALLRPAWRRLADGQPHLAFEYHWDTAGLQILLWVPGVVPAGLIERAIEAAWPAARTSTTPAAGPASAPLGVDARAVTAGELRLAAPEVFPLRVEHDADPLRALLGAAAALEATDRVCVQVLARPVTGRRLVRAASAARALRAGRPISRAGRLLDLLTPGTTATRPVPDPQRTTDIRAIMDKAAYPQWEAVVRYAVASTATTSSATSPAAAAGLRGRAHAVASAFALYSGRNRFARHRLRRPAQTLASRRMGRGDLLSVPELAALAHLPLDITVAGLTRAGAKTVAPPPGIPAGGKPLGHGETGTRQPVALAVADARQHLHILGATGSGKSTLLTGLVLSDVAAGRGAVVIDPKGDLVTDILDRLPIHAAGRTIILDPDDIAAPPSLNVLSGPDPDLVVDNLVGIFRSIFERFWGPRTDDVLRAAALTLLHPANADLPPPTLVDIPRLLSDERFRAAYTTGISDPAGLGGFWAGYDTMGDAARAQVIGPLLNKLRAFLLRDYVRGTVASVASSFDMTAVLDGGLLLARVPKGILGEDTARLLGSFVVAQVWQAATHRARQGQQARVDAALYVDECQNFLTLPRSFDEMLAEARGYRLSLVLAHQHLAQLPRDLREGVSANARSKLLFNLSPEDARTLERHVAPELSAHDLSHLAAYTAAARLVVGGAETPAFTIATDPPVPAIAGRADQVRAVSRARYGRSPAERRAAVLEHRRAQVDDPARAPASGNPAAGFGHSPGRSAGRPGGRLDRPTHNRANPQVNPAGAPDAAPPDSLV